MSGKRERVPSLVFSVPCADGVAGCVSNEHEKRGWKVASHGAETLEAIKDARGVSFLDMDEDVMVFLFLVLYDCSDLWICRELLILWSNERETLGKDTFFLFRITSTTTLSF